MKKLYLECDSGISGDMMVAVLLDLGADEKVLRKALESIPDQSFKFEISRVKKFGIDCMDFNVKLDHKHENHDHDMEYLHGHPHYHHIDEVLDEDEEHHHAEHEHQHHYLHRGVREIQEILNEISMTDEARELALRVFEILAQAESKVHGCSVDEVHFHEVGAIDSIVDIVATAVCMDNLGVQEVVVPRLCEGTGNIRCQHGMLPIPVPATAQIMADYKLPVEFMNLKGEFITPTGAAIVAALMTSNVLPKRFCIDKIGMGAGKREYEKPSILRAMLIENIPCYVKEVIV